MKVACWQICQTQIDAKLSEEGGSICQAESVPVQPYSHEPYRLDSDEEATENDQPGGAEAGRYRALAKDNDFR